MAVGLALKLGLLALVTLVGQGKAVAAPKVEVYTRNLVSYGTANVLNCFVSGFHPPKIEISLLKNGEPMTGVMYSDMSFDDKWQFQRLVYVPFTPKKGDIYVCRVTHPAFPDPQSFRWDPDF
ncbi:beta-2-microglobulin [Rhynochetos jubatus]